MAHVVRRNERDTHVTDHGKRAELQRAETEEVELLAGGFVSARERPRDWASIHPCLPDAARVGGRSCSLDNENLTFSCMFKIQETNTQNNFNLKPKA